MAMGMAEPGRAREDAAPAGGPAAADAGAAMRDLEAMLREMRASGRADPALLCRIADLRRIVDGAMSRWEGSGIRGWFSICQMAFKFSLVLDKMEEGIRAEAGGAGRPGIASDSLSVMPAMSRALGIAMSDGPDPGLAGDALDAVGDLIRRSKDAGLGTPVEELDNMIDWDEWRRVKPAVMRNMES